jgi:hypothetical protein
VSAPRRAKGSLEVRVSPSIWAEEVERLRPGSPARVAAERERKRPERDGLSLEHLLRCEALGSDRTRLGDQLKVYVPITSGPASERPFGFVLSLGVDGADRFLSIVSFGARHPERGSRSVYERAHKRLHGRYPDQERTRPEGTGLSPQVRSPSRGLRRGPDRGGLQR